MSTVHFHFHTDSWLSLSTDAQWMRKKFSSNQIQWKKISCIKSKAWFFPTFSYLSGIRRVLDKAGWSYPFWDWSVLALSTSQLVNSEFLQCILRLLELVLGRRKKFHLVEAYGFPKLWAFHVGYHIGNLCTPVYRVLWDHTVLLKYIGPSIPSKGPLVLLHNGNAGGRHMAICP